MSEPPKKGRLVTQSVGEVTAVFFQDARILDETTVKAIADELMALVDSTYKIKLLLDFSNVEYLSSAVLGKLVATYKKVQEGKGQMKLCAIKPAIKEVFKITKLDKMFDIHDTQAAALNSFQTKKFGIF
ncbi:MAG: STAS domain-containing protein [Planctomycetes bacterium]|nr:STAS domain-containing protein [Planctomycetota bacterium]